MSKVYIKLNENKHVCDINSDNFLTEDQLKDYICIDEGDGDKYAHAQNHYLEKGLMDRVFRYNYKYVDDHLEEITDEEKDQYWVIFEQEPTEQEKINAQLMLEIAKLKAGVR